MALSKQDRMLLVPSQNSNKVVVLVETGLLEGSIPEPGVHGAAISRDGRVFNTTSVP